MSARRLYVPAACVAYWSVWVDLGRRVWERPELVVHLAALAIGLRVLWQPAHPAHGTAAARWSRALDALPISAALTFALAHAHTTPMVHCAIALVGLASATWAQRHSARPWLGMALVLMALPALDRVELWLGLPLRVSVADTAAALLRLPGMAVVTEGTRLAWDGGIVDVDAPCSGLRMLWTGMFATLLALWRLRPGTVRALGICVMAAALVWLGNVFRCTGLFYIESGMVPAPEGAHAAVGVVVFSVVCLALWEAARWLSAWRPSW